MTSGGYIAQIPLKYFKNMTLDLFPGKLLRGRVISSEDGKLRIELGGAQLEAKTSKTLAKGDTVILRVKNVSNNGVSLQIVDTIARSLSGSNKQITPADLPSQTESPQMTALKQAINRLFNLSEGKVRISGGLNLNDLLKTVLEPSQKYNFHFIAIPINLDDNRQRNVEILMRELEKNENNTGDTTRELFFSISTPRLGNISGKILTVGKRMRIDLVSSSESVVRELGTITGQLKESLISLGYNVTSLNIIQGKPLTAIEYHLEKF